LGGRIGAAATSILVAKEEHLLTQHRSGWHVPDRGRKGQANIEANIDRRENEGAYESGKSYDNGATAR
jgi:hypothetical protein